MSGNSQAGRKKASVRVAAKVQAKHIWRSLRRLPDYSWSRREHIVMEPVTATGSVRNQDWYVVRGAKGGPLVRVDVDVVGGVV